MRTREKTERRREYEKGMHRKHKAELREDKEKTEKQDKGTVR
jgi:hypothetical protein